MLYIDGNNLLFAMDLEPGESGRNALCRKLSDFAVVRENHIKVVFDAYKTENKSPVQKQQGSLSIIFTSKDVTADQHIAGISRRKPGKKNTLVTSDRKLESIVQKNNWKTIKSDVFAKELSQRSLNQHGGIAAAGFSHYNDRSLFSNLDNKSSNNLREFLATIIEKGKK